MNKPTTLHVVMGSTGEYSDRQEWSVRAFLDERAAADLVVKATARAREIERAKDDRYDRPARGVNEHDLEMSMDYTGTSYYVMTVPLDDAVRQDIAAAVLEDVEAGRIPRRGIQVTGALGGQP